MIVGDGGGLCGVGHSDHLGAFVGGEEFAFFIEQLERIPRGGIVRGRQDDAAGSLFSKEALERAHHSIERRGLSRL